MSKLNTLDTDTDMRGQASPVSDRFSEAKLAVFNRHMREAAIAYLIEQYGMHSDEATRAADRVQWDTSDLWVAVEIERGPVRKVKKR